MYKKTTLMVAVLLMLPVVIFAQGITTAALNGTVKTQSGDALVGANVVVVHEPSGTTFGAATRNDGRYNVPGLRIGGPYTVTVSYIGYKTVKQEDVHLAIAQDLRIVFTLSEEAVELAEIVTVAERDAILTASNTGTISNVTTAQIEALPTITRSISDFTRLAPQVNTTGSGTSIAGKNNHQNNFQVDGAVLRDAFGLNADGSPTGSARSNPISLDAIQEFQVQIAPYDVRSGSFAGGLINAVTRSGTNQFEGSAYFFGQNQSFVGDFEGSEFGDFDDFQSGFRLGGPLVQDKVFFFVSGEIRRRNFPDTGGLLGSGQANEFPISVDQMNQIIDIANNVYGYNPGGFSPFTNETNDQKIFARLDINLSQQHRLTVRHNFVDADLDDGIRRSTNTFTLESNQFKRDNQVNSTVVQLNSTFGSNMANEFRLGYTTVRDKRSPLFADAPEFQINLEDAGSDLGEIRFGVERFSQANALDQNTFEFTNNLLYYTGDHTLTFGTHNEFISFNNLFIQDAFGAYEFDVDVDPNSPNGLGTGQDPFSLNQPDRFFLSQSNVTGVDQPRAKWDYLQLGFYVQDEWKPSPKLNLTFGLRADIPIISDEPLENPLFETTFGRSTTDVPSGNILWQPRVGFNYDLSEDRTTQIRGGFGMFAGLPPAVWLSNAFSNTGVDFARVDLRGQEVIDAGVQASADPNNQPNVLGEIPTADIALTDKDFKNPQVLRTNLAIDRQIQPGLVGTVEFMYSKNINEVRFINLNIGDPNNPGAPVGTLPDGRPDYGGDRVSTDFNTVILLDNVSSGHQLFLTGRVQKQLGRGFLPNLGGSLSYTYGRSDDVNSGTSSRSISNWQFQVTTDPNGSKSATSLWETRHRIVGNLFYGFNYGQGLGTTFALFYQGRSGEPFSYLYDNNINGDRSRGDNDLVFVPASQSDISGDGFATQQDFDAEWAKIETFINSSDALKDARGKIFPRNSARAPWNHRLDLRVAQKLPSVRNQNFELTLDVINVLNLLNDDWGQVKRVSFGADNFLDFRGYDAAGKPKVTLDPRERTGDDTITQEDSYSTSSFASRWQMQLGVRYNF